MDSLIQRSIFHHDDDHSSDSHTCPALPEPVMDADKVIGNFTVHQFLLVFGGASAIVAIALSWLLFLLHAFNLRNPAEQLKIMRIVTIIPVFSVIAFVSIAIGQSSIYLTPWMDVYESICVGSFYLLIHVYIAPTIEGRAEFFAHLPYKRSPKGPIKGNNSLKFWRRTQLATFQSLPVDIIVAIATDATQALGFFCINSNSPHFAHIWLAVLRTFATSIAVFAVIRLTYRLKPEFPDKNMPTQLWAFKLIVGLSAMQQFGFSIAAGQITPTNTLSYNDISVGLPNALLNVEMVGFAIFFFKAYSWKQYTAGGEGAFSESGKTRAKPVMNAFSATVRAVNPFEVFVALFQIFSGKWKVQSGTLQNDQAELLSHQAPPGRNDAIPQQPYQWPGAQPAWQQEQENVNTSYNPHNHLAGSPYDPHNGEPFNADNQGAYGQAYDNTHATNYGQPNHSVANVHEPSYDRPPTYTPGDQLQRF